MAVDVGTLIVTMGMDTGPYVAGTRRAAAATTQMETRMTRASGLVKGALGGMLAAFSIDAVTRMTKAGLDHASALGEEAQQLGVTTDALQSYRYAATQTGVSQEDMDKSLSKLNRTIGQAANGNKSATGIFQRLGVSIRDANGRVRDIGEILPEVADGINKLGSEAERATARNEVFGRSGGKLAALLNEGASGIAAYTARARELGIVLSSKEIANADKAADDLSTLNQVLNMRLNAAVAANAEDISTIAAAMTTLAEAAIKVTAAMARFARQGREDANAINRATADIRARSPIIAQQDTWFGSIRLRNMSAEDQVEYNRRRSAIMNDEDPGAVAPAARRQPARRAAPAARAPGRTGWMGTPQAQRTIRNFVDDMADQALNGAPVVVSAMESIERQVVQLGTAMTNADPSVQSLMDRIFPVEARARQLQEEIALINSSTLATEQKARAIAALRREYGLLGEGMTDWRDVIGDVGGDKLDEDMDRVRSVLDTVVDGFADTADRAEVQNVRIVESTAAMAQDVISELDGLTRGIKSGNFFDILSGVLGTLDKIGSLAGGFNLGPLQFGGARANGGAVRGGSTYLVGERGPELFRAGASGAIIPNHALGGGGGQTIHINVNAQGAVLAGQVEAMVAAGVEIASQRGAAMGANRARSRMIRDNSRVPA